MYAIINKKTKKWYYGHDFSKSRPTARTSFDNAMIFEYRQQAEIRLLKCSKDYKIVRVELKICD